MRTGGYYLGGLLFYVVPLLPIFPSHSITPHTLAVSVVVAAVFTLPAFFYCIKMTPKRVFIARNTHIEQTDAQEKRLQSLVILKSIITNKPLLLFLLAFVFGGVGIGMYVGLSYIFADSFLGMGERLPLIYLFSMASGILSVAVWHKLACRVNKTLIWGAGVLILMAGVLGTTRLVPGESSWLSLLFLEVLFATGSTAIAVFTAAILADIVDYATLKSGQDYAGSYYAVYTLALKSNIAIGAAIGLMVAGFSGFDASAVSHDDAHILGLHLAIAYIPAVSIAISLIFIALTPIGERRQTIIRRRLNNNTLRKSIDG